MATAHFPDWLYIFSIASLTLAFVCALVIVADEIARPQMMWIMNLVWPLCALFGSVVWLAFYFIFGRGMPRQNAPSIAKMPHAKQAEKRKPPVPIMIAKGSSHCGAGCTLGDIIAEWLAFAVPGVAVGLGWRGIFSEKMFAVWVLDYLFAFGIGVGFQYFTIKPMRHLSTAQGIVDALKADFASITAWQVGMYGFMAFAQFVWFAHAFGGLARVDTPEFWFMMQIAMLFGFATSYPVNWLLIRRGVKEEM